MSRTFFSARSMSFIVRPRTSPIRMPVRKRRRIKARSRVSWITSMSFLTSLGAMARGSVSGSFSLIRFFNSDGERISCSMRKWRKAMTETIRVLTVEMYMPRSCSCSMKASRSERSICVMSVLPNPP